MERVEAKILGREYSLACPPEGKQTLESAVAHVTQLTDRVQASGKVVGNERIAIMVAIQVAAELLDMKVPSGDLADLSVGEFKRRIDSINAVLDTMQS
ncbi:cell division protein ZapA [Orrella sp. 11846]|uniref:cell division protein ZapA n=1 Tax=Orrella sp. 11846 TaxID=3409913 RepID=UPI003B5CFF91